MKALFRATNKPHRHFYSGKVINKWMSLDSMTTQDKKFPYMNYFLELKKDLKRSRCRSEKGQFVPGDFFSPVKKTNVHWIVSYSIIITYYLNEKKNFPNPWRSIAFVFGKLQCCNMKCHQLSLKPPIYPQMLVEAVCLPRSRFYIPVWMEVIGNSDVIDMDGWVNTWQYMASDSDQVILWKVGFYFQIQKSAWLPIFNFLFPWKLIYALRHLV